MFTAAFTAVSMGLQAQDWPQYMGPTRNGYSPQQNILRSWPSAGPQVLWESEVGIGFGGPSVVGGKVYLLDRQDDDNEAVRCLDLTSGRELWKYAYKAEGKFNYPGSRGVPTVDSGKIYTCGQNGDLYCLDASSHQVVWHHNIWTEFGGGTLPFWAVSQCPLIYGDMVIVLSGTPSTGMIAFNKNSGQVVWKTGSLGDETYASPTLVRIDGKDQIAIAISSTNSFRHAELPVQRGKIYGLDPATGGILWRYDGWDNIIQCSEITDCGQNRLLAVGGYDMGSTMLQISQDADGRYQAKALFSTTEFGDHTKPAILYKDHLYAEYGTNNRRDGMVCMDLQGNLKWKTGRNPNFDKGSIIVAGDLFLASDGVQSIYLIEPSPEGYRQISKMTILKSKDGKGGGSQNWAPLALADGKLLVRDQARMYCVKVAE